MTTTKGNTMIATFDVYGNTAKELTAKAEAEAAQFFGPTIHFGDHKRYHIEAEALQTVVGDIIGWVGHVTAGP